MLFIFFIGGLLKVCLSVFESSSQLIHTLTSCTTHKHTHKQTHRSQRWGSEGSSVLVSDETIGREFMLLQLSSACMTQVAGDGKKKIRRHSSALPTGVWLTHFKRARAPNLDGASWMKRVVGCVCIIDAMCWQPESRSSITSRGPGGAVKSINSDIVTCRPCIAGKRLDGASEGAGTLFNSYLIKHGDKLCRTTTRMMVLLELLLLYIFLMNGT